MPSSSLPRFLLPVVLVLATFVTVEAAAPAGRLPNIVFVLADDLGYGDVGCFGQTRIKTPVLDRLAREGMRFTQFYSGSTVCAPARNALMTGQHTGNALLRGNAKTDLRPEDTTVAEILRDAGYATGIIGKWGLGKIGSTGEPAARGFTHAFGYIDQTHAHNYFPSFLVRNGQRTPLRNVVPDEGIYGQGVASERVDYAPDLFIDDAVDFIRRHRDQPFFLYFATILPHANNEAGNSGMEIPDYGEYATEDWPENEKGFAAMVTRLDRDVGRIVATLDELGLSENTLVFFTSDNGPHREGGHDPAFFASSGPLRGMKRSLHEGGIRVPTIARWTGRVPAGSVSTLLASLVDFLPTAAELAGVTAFPRRDGRSFAPTLLGHTAGQTTAASLYWEFHEGGKSSQAVRLGRWKALRAPLGIGPIELYDLETDLGETTDVASAHTEIVHRARAAMDAAHTPSPHWPVGR